MRRKPELVVTALALLLAAFAGGFFLGRATTSPESTVVMTERIPPDREAALAGSEPDSRPAEPAPAPTFVNINTADAEELSTLPGIGPTLAGRIVDYRAQNGPFTSVEELTEVSGIGEKKLDEIKALITVGG